MVKYITSYDVDTDLWQVLAPDLDESGRWSVVSEHLESEEEALEVITWLEGQDDSR